MVNIKLVVEVGLLMVGVQDLGGFLTRAVRVTYHLILKNSLSLCLSFTCSNSGEIKN